MPNCTNFNLAASCWSSTYIVHNNQITVISTFTGGSGCSANAYKLTVNPNNGEAEKCANLDVTVSTQHTSVFVFVNPPGTNFTSQYDPIGGGGPGAQPAPHKSNPCQNKDRSQKCFRHKVQVKANFVEVSSLLIKGKCPAGPYLRTVVPNNADPIQCDIFDYQPGVARTHTFTFPNPLTDARVLYDPVDPRWLAATLAKAKKA